LCIVHCAAAAHGAKWMCQKIPVAIAGAGRRK
jgi:hypothetical protein